MAAQEFKDIVEAHYKEMKNKYVKKVSRKCGDYAEDAVQQTYLKCLAFENSFHMGLKFDNWFKRILFTTVSDYRRFANGQPLVDIDETEVDPIEEMGFQSSLKYSIWAEIGKIENPEEAEVVGLNLQYGYKPKEITAITGSSIRNVNYWLNKFKEEMKKKYA